MERRDSASVMFVVLLLEVGREVGGARARGGGRGLSQPHCQSRFRSGAGPVCYTQAGIVGTRAPSDFFSSLPPGFCCCSRSVNISRQAMDLRVSVFDILEHIITFHQRRKRRDHGPSRVPGTLGGSLKALGGSQEGITQTPRSSRYV